jgi:aldose 1-epimerase
MGIANVGSEPATAETEITLALGSQRAVVSPFGASLRRYFRLEDDREVDIVWGYSGSAHKKGGQGDVLCPFPGRIANGRYLFDGQTFQLDCNDKEGPNAIHGFVRSLLWNIAEVTHSSVLFTVTIDRDSYATRGYPFTLDILLSYSLDQTGLSCQYSIRNAGSTRAPVGIGFHPYFSVGTAIIDEAEVKIPAAHYLEFGETLAPTGKMLPVQDTEWDFREFRRIEQTRFNHCYIRLQPDQDGRYRASLRNPQTGRTITIEMDNTFTALVIYTGDAIANSPRRALAIEPMTCATDAFNHADWGLQVLPPGETYTGCYKVLPGSPA